MDVAGMDTLRQAEEYLKEGKKSSALPLLAGYVQQHPDSARGWWLLSFAVPEVKQQIDCLERALHIEPHAAPVRARLEKLKGTTPPVPAFVPPFVNSEALIAELQSAPPPQPERKPAPLVVPTASKPADAISQLPKAEAPLSAVQPPAVQRKEAKRGFQFAALAGMGIAAVVILGFAAVMVVRGLVLPARSAPPGSVTQILLPPTWTPTPTATLLPSLTPIVTPTFVTPTSAFVTPIEKTPVPKSQVGPYTGHYAPDFTLKEVYEGNQVSLGDFSGDVVLVLFWTTWCDYCEAQMSALQMIYQTHKDKGLTILAVNVAEKEALIRDFGKSHALTFHLLTDPEGGVSDAYEIIGFPTLFFVDRSGVITYIGIGMTDYWKINTKLGEIMDVQ
ncbi:MAG: TlpA family protein disulfide reductase [Chloroflexi bacterium]|nr:TlpA family protein disulfide reductase [Chloroflexota bacterium]